MTLALPTFPAASLPFTDPLVVASEFLEGRPDYFNDLEEAAFHLMPNLATIKKELIELGFEQVIMTGSGSAFFCIGEISKPALKGLRFYQVDFLKRSERNWYEFSTFC